MASRLEVHGLNKLTRALKKAGVEMKDLKDANVRVGDIVATTAKPITPHATGALARSIKPARRQSGVVIRAGGGRIRYAKFVEYGTRKMAARSYLVKAAHDSQPRWMDQYEQELQKLMNHVGAVANGTGELAAMKRLAVHVEMLDGRVFDAKCSTPDYILYETTARRQKPPWGGLADSPSQWEAFVSWAALRRTGKYDGSYDAFMREVDLVDASADEPVDPTSVDLGVDSSPS